MAIVFFPLLHSGQPNIVLDYYILLLNLDSELQCLTITSKPSLLDPWCGMAHISHAALGYQSGCHHRQALLFKPCNQNECRCFVGGRGEVWFRYMLFDTSPLNVVDWVQRFSEMKIKCFRYYKTVQDIEEDEFQLQ